MTSKQANTIDAEVGKRVNTHRRRLGLSQTELGVQIGVTFQQIQKYERGTNRIGAGRLFQIAAVLKIPIQTLFPDSSNTTEQAGALPSPSDDFADLLLTAEGRRLSLAFTKIQDARVRKSVVALIESITGQTAE